MIKEGYKKTEIGVIPVEWEVVELEKGCSRIIGGGTPSKNNDNYWNNGTILWATPTEFTKNNNRFISTTTLKITQEGLENSSATLLKEGTVIMSSRATIGECKINTIEMTTNQGFISYECNQKLNNVFLLYLISFYKNRIIKVSSGSTFLEVSRTTMRNFKIPLPPLKEQKEIANILSTADKKIEAIELQIQKAETLKKGLLQKLLSDELWENIKLEDISDFITKGSTPTTYGFDWQEEGILFLRSECVSKNGLKLEPAKYISKEAHAHLARSEIKANDILITITGNVGRVILLDDSFVTANINQHIARIRINDKTMDTKFILHFLSQQSVRLNYLKITTGQAYPQISLKQVRETFVPKISLKEQKQIAQILSTADKKLELLRAKKEKYETLKKGLLQKLLSGEVRVGCCP